MSYSTSCIHELKSLLCEARLNFSCTLIQIWKNEYSSEVDIASI